MSVESPENKGIETGRDFRTHASLRSVESPENKGIETNADIICGRVLAVWSLKRFGEELLKNGLDNLNK